MQKSVSCVTDRLRVYHVGTFLFCKATTLNILVAFLLCMMFNKRATRWFLSKKTFLLNLIQNFENLSLIFYTYLSFQCAEYNVFRPYVADLI